MSRLAIVSSSTRLNRKSISIAGSTRSNGIPLEEGASYSATTVIDHEVSKVKAAISVQTSSRRHFLLHGWHIGVLVCAVAATFVLMVNIAITIWATTTYGVNGGIGTIYDGSCNSTKNLSLWLHQLINILSIALLAASNYCMQCLAAPTRQEIQQAHLRHRWLDIGVPSLRNLPYISKSRFAVWTLIAISSIPLHLFYNSVIFSTLSARKYDILTISPNLATGTFFNESAVPPDAIDPGPYGYSESDRWTFASFRRARLINCAGGLMTDVKNDFVWQRLENKDCIQKYGKQFVSKRGEFLAVSPALNDSYSIKYLDTAYPKTENGGGPSYNWMCDLFLAAQYGINDEQCRLDILFQNAPSWAIRSNRRDLDTGSWQADPIDHCLSLRVQEHCRLQFSLAALMLVIGCNLVQAVCMIVIIYRREAKPLVTLGDAISSFLEESDTTTSGSCVASKKDILRTKWLQNPKTWKKQQSLWFESSSSRRWIICNLL